MRAATRGSRSPRSRPVRSRSAWSWRSTTSSRRRPRPIDAVLAVDLPDVEIELIVVESNSTDGTRGGRDPLRRPPPGEAGAPGRARGKGNAVREGLRHATRRHHPDPGRRPRVLGRRLPDPARTDHGRRRRLHPRVPPRARPAHPRHARQPHRDGRRQRARTGCSSRCSTSRTARTCATRSPCTRCSGRSASTASSSSPTASTSTGSSWRSSSASATSRSSCPSSTPRELR